ncbi:ABC transporter permease [Rhizobium sp. 18055]|uniref:ABC transporter permease n=1 Tax=Rhizobium sp. 18055 TaxID=2681403 RepID=UPI00135A5B60|nr:ABC transporter permease [Rhizobium sp. 18055]
MNTSITKKNANPIQLNRSVALAALFVVQIAVTSWLVPGYFDVGGLLDATRSFSEAGLVALGMTLIIITGGIDLSVGALMALVSVTIGFSYQAGLPLWLASTAGVGVGVLGGLFNGLFITYFRLHPLVVTLGTFALFRGIAFAVSDANAVSGFPDWFSVFGQTIVGSFPLQFLVLCAFVVLFWVLLSKSQFGRYVYAVGHNDIASRFAGIPTNAVIIAVYTLTGFLVGIAGLIYTSRIASARGNAGLGLELTVIAMVVLGGTKITGGSGTIAGTVMGILILSYLQDGLTFAGVRGDWGLIFIGIFLILGVFANEFFRERSR